MKILDKFEKAAKETVFIKNIKKQLDEYFSGRRKIFVLKINPNETEFPKRVWMELQTILNGKTKSYSKIAVAAGNKNAKRAIGNACNKNPIIIIIPCHRVISKNACIGGYAYGRSIKQTLPNMGNYVRI